jgi:hypothetical protein
MNQIPPDDEEFWNEIVDDDGDEGHEDVQGVPFWSGPSSVVPVADSDKFLVVDGPDAGRVSENGNLWAEQLRPAPRLLTRDDALDGNVPIFLAHRGGQHHKLLPHALARLHHVQGQNVAIGVVLRIPGQTPSINQKFFARCATAAVRVADPICYMMDEDVLRLRKGAISKQAIERAPYLDNLGSGDWIRQVLDAQREAGANVLLTPGRALDAGNAEQSLKALFEEAEQAVSLLAKGERLGLNLTVTGRWLAADDLREKLFNELLDREEHEVWFVRVQWRYQPSYTQLSSEGLLKGYKRLAELAIDEGRLLLLPQTGIAGWLMLAFGAKGFGVGTSGADQAFTEPGFARTKGATRKERYFERQLLHTVERSVHDVLKDEPDYENCGCPYCPALLNGPAWSHELSGLHGLYSIGHLTADVQRNSSRGGYHSAVRRVVRDAMQFASGKDLVDINAPQHLAAWDPLL